MATRPKYTYEVATNTAVGLWKIADRVFHDRRLTLGEKKRAWAAGDDLPILAASLSTLKVEGEDVTVEWIEENLSEHDVPLAFAYLLGGQEGVEKAQKALGGS